MRHGRRRQYYTYPLLLPLPPRCVGFVGKVRDAEECTKGSSTKVHVIDKNQEPQGRIKEQSMAHKFGNGTLYTPREVLHDEFEHVFSPTDFTTLSLLSNTSSTLQPSVMFHERHASGIGAAAVTAPLILKTGRFRKIGGNGGKLENFWMPKNGFFVGNKAAGGWGLQIRYHRHLWDHRRTGQP